MSPAATSKLDRSHHHHHQQQPHYDCHDDELSCKICLGGYSQRSPGQRPRTLHCQHTFCESCLQQLLTDRRPQRKQWQAEAAAASVKCPLCKSRTVLGPASIQGLPLNSTAIQHSGRMSGVRSYYRRQLHELQPRSAASITESSMLHFTNYGTSGSRVVVQRFESFHPPPLQDDAVDDSWPLTGSHRRTLRFADDDDDAVDPTSSRGCCVKRDVEDSVDHGVDDVFHDVRPIGVVVGQFGRYVDAPDALPGTFRSPSSIDCACDGRLVIVDADTGAVQIFDGSGDCLSGFRLVGARAACFIADAARGQSLAVATDCGVSVCDQAGRVDKHLPLGADLVAVAALRHAGGGVFVAAHRSRLTICDRYQPTALLRSLGCVRPLNTAAGSPAVQFGDIAALATTATPRVYVADAGAVLAVDVDSGTLLRSFTAAGTRLLRQPSAVGVDLVTGGVFVSDAGTRRLLQFEATGGRYRCVAELPADAGRCVALAAGPRDHAGHQTVYLVCRGHCSAQVHMYQI